MYTLLPAKAMITKVDLGLSIVEFIDLELVM